MLAKDPMRMGTGGASQGSYWRNMSGNKSLKMMGKLRHRSVNKYAPKVSEDTRGEIEAWNEWVITGNRVKSIRQRYLLWKNNGPYEPGLYHQDFITGDFVRNR